MCACALLITYRSVGHGPAGPGYTRVVVDLQHAPSTLTARFLPHGSLLFFQSHLLRKTFVLLSDKPLGQDIGDLATCRNIFKCQLALFDFLAQEVIAHFNVLRPVVKLGISCDGHGRLIVDMNSGWVSLFVPEFAQQLP